MLWVYIVLGVVWWYATAYYGLRHNQRHEVSGLGCARNVGACELFLVWLASPFPMFGLPLLYCAAIRAFLTLDRTVLTPLANWMFPPCK